MKKLLSLLLFCTSTTALLSPRQQEGIDTAIMPVIDISAQDLKDSTFMLNEILADEFVLLVKTLNYHWNLVGPEFHDYHVLFNDQYHQIFEFIDQIAERARAVGGIALGSMAEFIKASSLTEESGNIPSPVEMVRNLLNDHEAIIRFYREAITATAEDNRDIGTSNFLTELMQKHEKTAWMLRSLLERRK